MFGEFIALIVWVILFAAIAAIPFLLVFLGVKWAISLGIRDAAGKMVDTPGSGNARQILDGRYARGEIGREEYEQMRRDIQD